MYMYMQVYIVCECVHTCTCSCTYAVPDIHTHPQIHTYTHTHCIASTCLREVPHDVASLLVHLSQYVEQEWFDVKVECLVVQKEFGHETEVLAVDLMITTIHLKHRYCTLHVQYTHLYMYMYTCIYTQGSTEMVLMHCARNTRKVMSDIIHTKCTGEV